MKALKIAAVILLSALSACAGTGSYVPQEQAAQFQQAAGFPYNSFYCP